MTDTQKRLILFLTPLPVFYLLFAFVLYDVWPFDSEGVRFTFVILTVPSSIILAIIPKTLMDEIFNDQ